MLFIKENIFIILGVSLPLMLIALLALLQFASKISVEPPQHKVAYIVMNSPYGTSPTTNINHKTGELKISVRVPKNINNNINRDSKLYIYSPKSVLETYILDTSNISEKNQGKKISIPIPDGVKNLKFINNATSPDGYVFERGRYRSGNFITGIFGYRSHNRNDSITKNGVRTSLPNTRNWPKTHFVGWVEK